MNNNIIAFHIGRGGHFNNPGYITFLGYHTISDYTDDLFSPTIVNPADEGDLIDDLSPDAEWHDECGNPVGITNADIESGIGRIERDGDYNTTYTKYDTDELSAEEWEAVKRGYNNCMESDVNDLLRAHGIPVAEDIERELRDVCSQASNDLSGMVAHIGEKFGQVLLLRDWWTDGAGDMVSRYVFCRGCAICTLDIFSAPDGNGVFGYDLDIDFDIEKL